jgi:hypothetical protein
VKADKNGFHVLALPALVWGIRRRQFAGREQKEWNLDDAAAPDTPPAPVPPAPMTGKARLMLGILSVVAAAVLGAVVLTVYAAMHAVAPAAVGQNPY